MRYISIIYQSLLILIISISNANSQDFKEVNWDKIDFEVNSPTSKYQYKELFKKFQENDTTLTAQDYFYLYYGYTTQENYKPLLESPYRDSLKMVFSKKNSIVNFSEIVNFSTKILKTEPFNIRDINVLAFAYNQLGMKDEAAYEMKKIEMIVSTIKSTGNGLTPATAWYVIYNENCEDMLSFMGFNSTRKMIVNKEVVFVQVSNMPETLKKFKGYYFNYAEIYKRKPTYLDGVEKPKRKMEFNPKYNPKSDLNIIH